ncbi:MAG: hypothetical protein R3A11_03140 [Bdellovibrionota bacterium]
MAIKFTAQKKQSGQILIVCLLLLVFLLSMFLTSFQQGIDAWTKIRLQKETDQMAMQFLQEEAQILNGIAIYNQTLRTIETRLLLIEAMVAAIGLCAMGAGVWVAPHCVRLLTRIGNRLPSFYKKIRTLITLTAQKQDLLVGWYSQKRCMSNLNWRLGIQNLKNIQSFSYAYPNLNCKTGLSPQDAPMVRMNEKNVQMGLTRKCKNYREKSILSVKELASSPYFDFSSSEIKAMYQSRTKQRHYIDLHDKKDLQTLEATITVNHELYFWDHALIQNCYSIKRASKKVPSLASMIITIPRPYVFTQKYLTHYSTIQFLHSLPRKRISDFISLDLFSSSHSEPKNMWGFSQAGIKHNDLQVPYFEASLEGIGNAQDFYQNLQANHLWYVLATYFGLPSKKEFSNAFHH